MFTDKRASGLLLPISALPSNHGIGTLGKEAYAFVDFLHAAGQTYWQVLPIGPTGYGDSPYQSFSSFAGNPYFVDLDELIKEGLLTRDEVDKAKLYERADKVDYGLLYDHRYPLLKAAFLRALEKGMELEIREFATKESHWLPDYALYMALKKKYDEKPWEEWPKEYRKKEAKAMAAAKEELEQEILMTYFIQMKFFEQWAALKKYANKKRVYLIGDLPIYVAADSSETWDNPELFHIDENDRMTIVGGVPPDDFSDDGQLWGNPLYKWEEHKKDDYRWWIERLKAVGRFYDVLRIDHFRGFEGYWGIPAKSKTAATGKWYQGPGWDFFRVVNDKMPETDIIAEDLGYMNQEVIDIRLKAGYPGMQILEFAFDAKMTSDALPHKHQRDNVVYIGSHDNQTLAEWLETAPKANVEYATNYFHLNKKEGLNWGFIRGTMSSVANTSIFQVQDLLFLGAEARMNTPATLGDNWTWRLEKGQLTDAIAKKLWTLTKWYGR